MLYMYFQLTEILMKSDCDNSLFCIFFLTVQMQWSLEYFIALLINSTFSLVELLILWLIHL